MEEHHGQALPGSINPVGTRKALVFHARDLPLERAQWDAIFLAAVGSANRFGLNGVGWRGIVAVKGLRDRTAHSSGADVDYTLARVQVQDARVDYSGNCGNMSSAIGPFAVDEGLVRTPGDGEATVRIHNTNTCKIIHSTFSVRQGRSAEARTLAIPGVDGTGAPVRLDFISRGAPRPETCCPRKAHTVAEVPGRNAVQASLVDASNEYVFVSATDIGLVGTTRRTCWASA
ncbi:PrpF domain-containing protein [Piscinibacter koreensis]|uniref:PrpF protein n=1 Tax=Piscinibacter koreensis TaxID=2742824 RepID=A0A7Y6NRM9_9BURK|nr:PrpF domain-containing protein [Schlegelella koreensis]NUZ08093.1 hypothetical protein [Schlegelella koreensis]